MKTVSFVQENVTVDIKSWKNDRSTYHIFSLEEKNLIAAVRKKQLVPIKPSGVVTGDDTHASGMRAVFDGLDELRLVTNDSDIDYPVE